MKRIFIIEDDLSLSQNLKIFLEQSGYESIRLTNFENVEAQILEMNPDLILLDINLPNMNGEYLLKSLRKKSNVPVIMLTSYNNEADEVLSMSYGADDYITKPYNPTILLLHIEAIFKRMDQDYSVINYDHLKLIPDRGILLNGKEEVYLTKNEILILKQLLLKRGNIVTREDIMRNLWDSEEFVDDNTLSVNISRLRNKLKDAGMEDAIETRKGIGYILK